jgi:phenylacetate-CoA ligase
MAPEVQYQGGPELDAAILEERNHLNFMSRAKTELIEAEQRRALGEVLELASKQSSWWRPKLREALEAFHERKSIHEIVGLLPVTTRRDIQENFGSMKVSVPGGSKADYMTVSTSGSTGRPVLVEKYLPQTLAKTSAVILFEANLTGRKPSLDTLNLTVRDDEYSFQAMPKPYSLVGWSGRHSQLSMALRSPEEILGELAKGKYGYLYGNANSLRLIAKEQLAKPRRLKVRGVQSWVDPVDDEFRELIKDAFGCKVMDRYSSEEFGPIAMQCPKYDHLHLISPYLYMEVVDDEGNRVQDGELGRIQVTSLVNQAMPLFRYQLGDLVVAGPPCKKVNWPTIQNIVGRVRDYIEGPDGQPVLPRIARVSFTRSALIKDFRVYLFDDKVVLLAATVRKPKQEEIDEFSSDLERAFYREPGDAVIVLSQEGKWREIWKRKVYERIPGPFSVDKVLEIANIETD